MAKEAYSQKPVEADDLTDAEKAAIEYADLFATNHFAIDGGTFDKLRVHFFNGEIIELGMFVGYFHGTGKFLSMLDMTEELPKAFQDKSQKATPWRSNGDVIVVQELAE